MVRHAQNVSLGGPGRDVGPLHGQRDAVGRDEGQDDEVEPALRGQLRTLDPQRRVRRPDVERVGLALGHELAELLADCFLVARHAPVLRPAEVVVGELLHDAPLALLLVPRGIVLDALH